MTQHIGELVLIAPFAVVLAAFLALGAVFLVRRRRRRGRPACGKLTIGGKPGVVIPKGALVGTDTIGRALKTKKKATIGPGGSVTVSVVQSYERRRRG